MVIVAASAATGAWTFGWDALVALGTLTLAIVTAIVAGFTHRVASKTGQLAEKTSELAVATQADVAAQFRPVLAPDRVQLGGHQAWWYEGADGLRVSALANIGHGPALDITVTATGSSQTHDVTNTIGVGQPAERVKLRPPIQPDVGGGFTIIVHYASIAGERYESEIAYAAFPSATSHRDEGFPPRLARVTGITGDAKGEAERTVPVP